MRTIHLSRAELQRRIGRVAAGIGKQGVSDVLGSPPFEEKRHESGALSCFWRFSIGGDEGAPPTYEIFLGEFVDDRLTFGSLIPRAETRDDDTAPH
jgi:hypothetical protein